MWQLVDNPTDPSSITMRLPVPGGWLYRFTQFCFDRKLWHPPVLVFVPEPRE